MYASALLFTFGLIGALSMASAQAASLTAEDFVTRASIANEFEIESSKLALEKSQDKEIKAFAQRMIGDHTKIGKDMQDIVKTSGSRVQPQTTLDKKHQKQMEELESLSTDDFNQQYVSMQTDAHKEAVSLFTDYARSGKDDVLKSFAEYTLPALKSHLEHVQQLKD